MSVWHTYLQSRALGTHSTHRKLGPKPAPLFRLSPGCVCLRHRPPGYHNFSVPRAAGDHSAKGGPSEGSQ